MTLKQLLQELSFVEINNIKRNAKGLLLALEKTNRKEFLDYIVITPMSSEKEYKAKCLECKKWFRQERDLQICDKCIDLFDTDKLWDLHDKNELDALDFNENAKMRERFRINKR